MDDLLEIDDQLTPEHRMVRDSAASFVSDRVLPYVGDWFEQGVFPARELAPELGSLGMLGMHLDGYGCAGLDAVSYGVACRELEAGDSGLRSFVSVQGSLAMFPIWKYGSEEQKQEWLPRMASGEAIGCFGLTERTTAPIPPACAPPPSRTRRATGSSTAPRCGSPTVRSRTSPWCGPAPTRHPRLRRSHLDPGFSAPEIHRKMSLRASVTSSLYFDDVRLPASAVLPGVVGLKGPLSCLSEARFGILWGVVGAGRACLEAAVDYAKTRVQFGKPIGAFQLTQEKLAWMAVALGQAGLTALHLGRLKDAGKLKPRQVSFGKLANVRAALDIAREARTVLGANGVTLEYPVIRHMNNLESVLTYEGTQEVHLLTLGKALTDLDAFR